MIKRADCGKISTTMLLIPYLKEAWVMPRGTNQKLKLYYLARIMVEKTDDEHKITMPEIKEA